MPRIELLHNVEGVCVRFLSIEPLLEDLGKIDLTSIHWVIVGGKSGPKARPMKSEWAENIQHQCQQAGVSFFSSNNGAHRVQMASDAIRKKWSPVEWKDMG